MSSSVHSIPVLSFGVAAGPKELFYPYGKTYVQTLGEQD